MTDTTTLEPADTEEPTPEDYPAAAAALSEQSDTPAGEQPDTTADNDEENPNHEAAKWRKKLRETETQRDGLATQLANMQRAAIDHQVTTMGLKPAALWASGAKLEELLDDTGVPDPTKVQQAAQIAQDTLGVIAYKPAPRSLQSGASAPPRHTPDPWIDAFSPNKQ